MAAAFKEVNGIQNVFHLIPLKPNDSEFIPCFIISMLNELMKLLFGRWFQFLMVFDGIVEVLNSVLKYFSLFHLY